MEMTKGWLAPPTPCRCSLVSRNPPPALFLLPVLSRRRSVSSSPLLLPLPPNCVLGSAASRCIATGGCTSGTRRALVLLTGSSLGFPAFPTLVISPSLAAPPLFSAAEAEEAGGEELLERYTDKAEGFTLLRPSSWLKVDKAGATVLFEGANNKADSIGVVVSPVRLSSLRDFGTPQFVAEKLIQAERRKESTKDAQMVRIAERVGQGGLPVYEFEYTVDSTRGGLKRIFSAAFAAARKLYLLNIACPDSSASPLDGKARTTLEKVLHSFDAV